LDPEIFSKGSKKLPVILKIVPEAGYDLYTAENRPMAEKKRKFSQWQRRKVGQKF
jgi:hypothetical protein